MSLIYVKEGLKDISQGESPVGCRTRRCLHEKNIVLCEEPREMLYLEDYESVSVVYGGRKRLKNQTLLKKHYAMKKC